MKKICLKKTKHTLQTFDYLKRCKECNCLFSISNTDDVCINCYKIILFYNKSNIIIFTIRDILQSYLQRIKKSLTFHDFEMLEKKMIETASKNVCFDYCFENVSWYIFFQNSLQDKIIHTLVDIIRIFINYLKIPEDNIFQQIKNEIIQKISQLNNQQKIHHLQLSDFLNLQNKNKLSLLLTNRNLMQKKFNQSFDFFEDY